MKERGWQGLHVALAGENTYEWIVAFFAAGVLNCPVVLVDIEQSVETIAKMLKDADSQVVFASAAVAQLIATEAPMPKLPLVALRRDFGISFERLLEQGRRLLEERFLETLPAEEELAVIAFTSGTTSASKPVMLSRKGILHNASELCGDGSPGERLFTVPALLPYLRPDLLCVRPLDGGNASVCQRQPENHDAGPAPVSAGSMMTVPLIVEMVHRRLAAASQERGLEEELNHKARRKFLRREPEASVSEKLENLKNEIFPEMQIIISGGAHLLPESPWS